jgi:hypothetical protein
LAELLAAGLAELQASAGLGLNSQATGLAETRLATVAEFGSPQTGPDHTGPPLAAQASLRLVTS